MVTNLSIIIPVYNEEGAIEETLKFFEDFLERNHNTEIIFVDDGSRDKTPKVLNAIDNEKIKTITHRKNRGYGEAIKTGLKNASYDYIAITDSDGSYPNEKITDLYEALLKENADMAVGARVGKIVEMGLLRRFAKYILRKLAEYLSKEEIPDLNSGLRITKREVILKFLRFLPERFSLTTTLTLLLLANNYKIIYLPIDYYKRKGKSKIKPLRDSLSFLQLILKTIIFFNPRNKATCGFN